MRKIDLGPDFVRIGTAGPCGLARGLSFAGGAEVGPYLFRFVVFNGTGMSLLLSDSNFLKYVENSFTLNFQLPGQVVDSNLHPPFLSSEPSR